MQVDPLEQATNCFKQFFLPVLGCVYLKKLFTWKGTSLLLMYYDTRSLMSCSTTFVFVEFISGQDVVWSRRYLTRILRLSSLCLDETRFSFPAVRFGSVKTDNPTSPLFDVVAPIQSYFSDVARGLDNLVSDASIARLLNLESTFESTGLSNTYSPWEGLDYFGPNRIRDAINTPSPERRKVTTQASTDQPCSSKSSKVRRSSKSSDKF